jgi:2-C-methyl-D-erythritol 2,4-cyclodiphosphate synthase
MQNLRIGLGVDSHRIGVGGPMRLGGIDIPCRIHLVGHSDGDVLLHAITDAVLGAAGLEDIGQLFPDTDPANKNRDSGEILSKAWERVVASGFQLVNLDCVVRIERPKLSPHKGAMRDRIANIFSSASGAKLVTADQISLKGKTGESTGDIGQGRLAEAHCVALLVRETLATSASDSR